MHLQNPPERFVFGDFDLDVGAYELRRLGRPVRLGRQSMELLLFLIERRGLLVTRNEIVERLWGQDVFVDVETGINTAISRIRQALRDPADSPAFLETVPGKGYRFVASVNTVSAAPRRHAAEVTSSPPEPSEPAPQPLSRVNEVGVRANPSSAPIPDLPAEKPAWTTAAGRRTGLVIAVALVVAAAIGATTLWNAGRASRVTVAVLPFEYMGNDPERAYLAISLTDETSASLAQVDPDHVIVKGRTLLYKGTTKPVAEIGRELSVDYLVESSVRTEGTRVRVTVTLIRVKDQEHIWSQSYDREPTSLLGLQDELSSAIAQQIHIRLVPERLDGLTRRQTRSPEAYELYLKGRHYMRSRTPEGNARAIDLYTRAVTLDPNYALVWSDLVFSYAGGMLNADAQPAVVAPLARQAASLAVRANPDLSESQLALGYVLWVIDWNWKAAENSLRLAVQLDPSNASAHRVLGHTLSQLGKRAEAEQVMARSRELDPFDELNHALSAQVAFQSRELPSALDHARKAIALNPAFWIGYMELAQAYEASGNYQLALEALDDATQLSHGNSKPVSLRGYVLAKMGRAGAAQEILSTLDSTARTRYVPAFAMALVAAGLGERDRVFDYLERAYTARDVHLMYLPVDVKWDPYRDDPRFVDLLARCGFATR
jgi:TolB-like protein/DNA-binding winged helix-turn-helix (wHTH) protein/tetratricopeptide (TPR) repeat protein